MFKVKREVLVVLKSLEDDRSVRGILRRGRWFGPYKIANASVNEGHRPVSADGEIWIPRKNVAWLQML